MPKVSVIIPYFKGQAYLEECVQSIEEQKIEDLEIIVVNDKDGHEVPDSVKENPHVKVFWQWMNCRKTSFGLMRRRQQRGASRKSTREWRNA